MLHSLNLPHPVSLLDEGDAPTEAKLTVLDLCDGLLFQMEERGIYEPSDTEKASLHWRQEAIASPHEDVADHVVTDLRKDEKGRVDLLFALAEEPGASGYAFLLDKEGLRMLYEEEIPAFREVTSPEEKRTVDFRLDSRGLPVAFIEDAPESTSAKCRLHAVLSPSGRRLVDDGVLQEERNYLFRHVRGSGEDLR